MATKKTTSPPPAYRVFISSTYEDMKEYREAANDALRNIKAVAMGMERFTAAEMPPIERCFEEIQECQFCISILGFRYGSLYKNTSLSYSELEFNEAERLGIPILVFIRKGEINANNIDVEDFTKRDRFKKKLQSSASNRLTVEFTTPDDLRDKITRALQDEFKRNAIGNNIESKKDASNEVEQEEYIRGAMIYRNFILMPGEFCNQTVRLRVRLDGTFGSWRLKEELFEAYDIPVGRALYLNDLFVLGADYRNIGNEARHIDAFAVGDAARWILDNRITRGSVFECDFYLAWKYVRNVGGKANIQIGASNVYVAKLIIYSANINIITQSLNTSRTEKKIEDYSALGQISDNIETDYDEKSGFDQESLLHLLQKIT